MRDYTKKEIAEIEKVRKYLDENFKEENKSKDFSNSQAVSVYEAMGRKFDPKEDYSDLVGDVLRYNENINFRLRSFKKGSDKDLEGLVGKENILKKGDRTGTKYDSYGQIITSVIFISLICAGIFSLGKFTGYNIITLFEKVDFSIATIIFIIGLFLFGLYFYLNGGKKNGRR